MKDDFVARVAAFVRTNALIGSSARVAVALSGGPDSVALLLALVRGAERGLLPRPALVLHFHHGIRGADADADAAFCASLCARLGLPCVVGLGFVPQKNGAYSNADARRARYAFLEEAAREHGANTLATAHTKNDQAETVLWRVVRGTGLDGLSGIPARRELSPGLFVIRPLLNESREAIEAFCRSEGVTPRRDPTNANPQFTRVRMRSVLPDLARDFNLRIWDALPRLAAHAARDADLLNTLAEDLWAEATQEAGPNENAAVCLCVAPLQAAHPALRTRVLLRALRRASQNLPEAEEAATDAFVNLLEKTLAKREGGTVDLPGKIRAHCDGEFLTLAPVPAALLASGAGYELPLFVPGSVQLPGKLGFRISAAWCREAASSFRRSPVVYLACPVKSGTNGTMVENTVPALAVRNARPGDRFAPLGMNGKTRLVRDLLADAKVPVGERGTFPVVVRGDTGAVLWVVGVAQAEETRITSETETILRLCAEPVEN